MRNTSTIRLLCLIDFLLIERVLVNLLGKVVEFAPQGGRVEMGGQEDGDGDLLRWVCLGGE